MAATRKQGAPIHVSLTLRSLESYAAAARPGTVEYIELARASRSLPKGPDFIFGPMTHLISTALFGEYDMHAVGCYTLHDACVSTEGIVMHGDSVFETLALNYPSNYVAEEYDSLIESMLALPRRQVPGDAVLLFGPGYPVFGHWIVDFLPRLFVLHRLGFALSALRYAIPADAPAFVHGILNLVGITSTQIIECDVQAEIVQFDRLLMVTNLRRWDRLSPLFSEFARFLIDRITASVPLPNPPIHGREVFLSRIGTDDSRILENRSEIEALAASEGLVVLNPRDLSLTQQISLFRETKLIVGEYGSGLHNSVFSAPGAFVFALRTTTEAPGFIQSGICHAMRQGIGYAFGGTYDAGDQYIFTVSRESFLQGLEYIRLRECERAPARG